MRYWQKLIIVFLFVILFSSFTYGQPKITRSSGGSIKTELGYGIILNRESSLEREWITIHDDSIPADLVGTVGVRTIYEEGGRYSSGGYRYTANYTIKAMEALTAFEVRFLLFDIWGNHIRTLSATGIIDLKAGETRSFDAEWILYSENEASEYYASIAYIAQVRTKSGRVIKANPKVVIKEARKFSSKFAVSDLEPKPEKK